MRTRSKLLIVVGLVLGLYLFPPTKTVYDMLYNLALSMRPTASEFDRVVLQIIPLVMLGAILYGVFSVIFKRRSM